MKKPLLAFFCILCLSLAGCIIYLLATEDRSGNPEVAREFGKSGRHPEPRNGKGTHGTSAGNTNPPEEKEALTLDQARKLLDRYKLKDSNIINQADFAAELMVRLCKEGNTREAWEFIEPNRGQMRDKQLLEFFKHADLDRTELLARLSAFEFINDSEPAFDGYLLRFKPSEMVDELRRPEMAEFNKLLSETPSALFNFAMENLNKDLYGRKNSVKNPPDEALVRDFLDTLSRLESEGNLSKTDFHSILTTGSFGNFRKWEVVSDQMLSPEGKIYPAVERIIENMVTTDPEKGMRAVLSAPSALENGAVYIAVRSWLGADNGSALRWYSDHQASLPVSEQSALASAFAEVEKKRSDFDSARRWADQIRDPALREQLLRTITESEADASAGTR